MNSKVRRMGEVAASVRVRSGFYCKIYCKQCDAVQHCVYRGISIGRRRAKLVSSRHASLFFEESTQKLLAVGSFKSVKLNETTCL